MSFSTPILLNDRGILGLESKSIEHVQDFLQALVTQDMSKLNAASLVYGLHLTSQGRLRYDFFAFQHPQNPNMICLDVHKNTLMDFAQKLHQFALNGDIDFHNLSDEIFVVASPITITLNAFLSSPDPRFASLGYRYYLLTSESDGEVIESIDEYHAYRIEQGVPDVAYDVPFEKALPAEVCMDKLNAIDFKKGCYVGQEVTARMHYRSSPKKQLYIAHHVQEYVSTQKYPNSPPIRQENDNLHHKKHQNAPKSDKNSHITPLFKTQTTSEVGWLGKSFKNKALSVIQTRINPNEFSMLNLTLPQYFISNNLIKKQ